MDFHPLQAGAIMKLIGVTHRQLDYLTHKLDLPTDGAYHRLWDPDVIRRLQAAVALARANPFSRKKEGVELSLKVAGAVMAGPPPQPTRWVALVDGTDVHYVNYLSDLEAYATQRVSLALLPALWPDIPEEDKIRIMSGGRREGSKMCICAKHRQHEFCGTDDYQCPCLQ